MDDAQLLLREDGFNRFGKAIQPVVSFRERLSIASREPTPCVEASAYVDDIVSDMADR
jgi:hypothetical protein